MYSKICYANSLVEVKETAEVILNRVNKLQVHSDFKLARKLTVFDKEINE